MYEILDNIDRLYDELGKEIANLRIFLTVNPESGLRSVGKVDEPVSGSTFQPTCTIPEFGTPFGE